MEREWEREKEREREKQTRTKWKEKRKEKESKWVHLCTFVLVSSRFNAQMYSWWHRIYYLMYLWIWEREREREREREQEEGCFTDAVTWARKVNVRERWKVSGVQREREREKTSQLSLFSIHSLPFRGEGEAEINKFTNCLHQVLYFLCHFCLFFVRKKGNIFLAHSLTHFVCVMHLAQCLWWHIKFII